MESSEKSDDELDDVADRHELRDRYQMLLQEVRVSLPGVQVLSAFLLTAPFSTRFTELDSWGRRAYGVALTSSMLSTVCLVSPAVLHRVGERTARAARLNASIHLILAGLGLLAIALTSAMWGICRFVFDPPTASTLSAVVLVALVLIWIVLPLHLHRQRRTR